MQTVAKMQLFAFFVCMKNKLYIMLSSSERALSMNTKRDFNKVLIVALLQHSISNENKS
ncbi:MAG: hypothetical protein XD91_1282 [Clostridiales bacterium 38_11]|nr:MAG: hypothetical protein XD91_1282 [Clostridiales bacterium 38_11]